MTKPSKNDANEEVSSIQKENVNLLLGFVQTRHLHPTTQPQLTSSTKPSSDPTTNSTNESTTTQSTNAKQNQEDTN